MATQEIQISQTVTAWGWFVARNCCFDNPPALSLHGSALRGNCFEAARGSFRCLKTSHPARPQLLGLDSSASPLCHTHTHIQTHTNPHTPTHLHTDALTLTQIHFNIRDTPLGFLSRPPWMIRLAGSRKLAPAALRANWAFLHVSSRNETVGVSRGWEDVEVETPRASLEAGVGYAIPTGTVVDPKLPTAWLPGSVGVSLLTE